MTTALSLRLMGLSTRVFGFLVQHPASAGALHHRRGRPLHATVRRLFGPAAGVMAAGMLAVTPVTVAIARVNNPDDRLS